MNLRARALSALVKDRARALGFAHAAVGPADPPPHGEAFRRWLEAGYAAGMSYLARGRDDRLDPRRLLPGARSVVSVALGYGDGDGDDPSWAPVARYARGRDYHDVMRPRLAALAATLRDAAGEGTVTRVAVDTSAVLERDLAARGGLGWIGKNTSVIGPTLGSYFLIGVVLTTAAMELDAPVADRCGTCTACLEACPTAALVAPYVLDARRCISYLTIEHRGEIPAEFRDALHGWIFGCDICQEVCPWNRKASVARDPELAPRGSLGELAELRGADDEHLHARFRRSALWRAKAAGLRRNVALVLAARERAERALGDDFSRRSYTRS